jgi:hypothetical protein
MEGWKGVAQSPGILAGNFKPLTAVIRWVELRPAQLGFVRPSGRRISGEFFVSGLVCLGKQVRIRGLLFDNLVSEPPIFLSAKDCTGGGFTDGHA